MIKYRPRISEKHIFALLIYRWLNAFCLNWRSIPLSNDLQYSLVRPNRWSPIPSTVSVMSWLLAFYIFGAVKESNCTYILPSAQSPESNRIIVISQNGISLLPISSLYPSAFLTCTPDRSMRSRPRTWWLLRLVVGVNPKTFKYSILLYSRSRYRSSTIECTQLATLWRWINRYRESDQKKTCKRYR